MRDNDTNSGTRWYGMIRPEWLQFHNELPKGMRLVQSWDVALKGHKGMAACLTIGDHKGKSYVVDSQIFELEYPELKAKIYEMAQRFQPTAILIEDESVGKMLLQDLRRESALPLVQARRRVRGKIERFAALSCVIESGGVSIPKHSQDNFVSELLSIPDGRHDDQVDALSQYLEWLRNIETRFLRIHKV